jgi:hypothetical protein
MPLRCYTVAVTLLYYCRRAIILLPSSRYTAAVTLLYCCRRAVILLPSRFYIAAVATAIYLFILLPSPLACCSTHAPDADDQSAGTPVSWEFKTCHCPVASSHDSNVQWQQVASSHDSNVQWQQVASLSLANQLLSAIVSYFQIRPPVTAKNAQLRSSKPGDSGITRAGQASSPPSTALVAWSKMSKMRLCLRKAHTALPCPASSTSTVFPVIKPQRRQRVQLPRRKGPGTHWAPSAALLSGAATCSAGHQHRCCRLLVAH